MSDIKNKLYDNDISGLQILPLVLSDGVDKYIVSRMTDHFFLKGPFMKRYWIYQITSNSFGCQIIKYQDRKLGTIHVEINNEGCWRDVYECSFFKPLSN